jgi:hypothetical protein
MKLFLGLLHLNYCYPAVVCSLFEFFIGYPTSPTEASNATTKLAFVLWREVSELLIVRPHSLLSIEG